MENIWYHSERNTESSEIVDFSDNALDEISINLVDRMSRDIGAVPSTSESTISLREKHPLDLFGALSCAQLARLSVNEDQCRLFSFRKIYLIFVHWIKTHILAASFRGNGSFFFSVKFCCLGWIQKGITTYDDDGPCSLGAYPHMFGISKRKAPYSLLAAPDHSTVYLGHQILSHCKLCKSRHFDDPCPFLNMAVS